MPEGKIFYKFSLKYGLLFTKYSQPHPWNFLYENFNYSCAYTPKYLPDIILSYHTLKNYIQGIKCIESFWLMITQSVS